MQFTLAEFVSLPALEPRMTEQQLRVVIRALGWKPGGKRHTGRPGNPCYTYDAAQLLKLHAALVPFLRIGDA